MRRGGPGNEARVELEVTARPHFDITRPSAGIHIQALCELV